MSESDKYFMTLEEYLVGKSHILILTKEPEKVEHLLGDLIYVTKIGDCLSLYDTIAKLVARPLNEVLIVKEDSVDLPIGYLLPFLHQCSVTNKSRKHEGDYLKFIVKLGTEDYYIRRTYE